MHIQTDKRFTYAYYLKQLMLIHTGEKQHVRTVIEFYNS